MVGTYKVDADSLHRHTVGKELAGTGGMLPVSSGAEIVIGEDHHTQLVNVPCFSHPSKYEPISVSSYSGSGSWKLGRNDDFWEIQVWNPKRLAGGCREAPELMLYGKYPPYKIHITLGDPDSGDAVQFEKIASM